MTTPLTNHLRACAAAAVIAATALPALADTPAPIPELTYDHASGSLLKASRGGLFRRQAEGDWQQVRLPEDTEVADVAVAADGQALYVAGPGAGVLRSVDDGRNWSDVSEGLPSDVTSIAAHSTQAETIYAYVTGSGIHRTQDGGRTWKLMDQGPEGIGEMIHTNMKGSMESGWLYVGTSAGAKVSMDCFCLWRPSGKLEGEVASLAFDPARPEHLYAASPGGIVESTDGGKAWAPVPGPEDVTALATGKEGALYAATADGTVRVRSADGEWKPLNE